MNFSDVASRQYDRVMRSSGKEERHYREESWRIFQSQGLPDRRVNGWRYSNLSSLVRSDWKLNEDVPSLPTEAVAWRDRLKSNFDVAVLVNGSFLPQESFLSKELKACVSEDFSWRETEKSADGMQQLVAAVATQGLRLRLPENSKMTRPLAMMHIQIGAESWSASHHQIEMGSNSQLDIADVYLGGDERYLRTQKTSVHLGSGSALNWSVLQWEGSEARHYVDLEFALEHKSQLVLHSLQAGALWARSNFKVDILGAEAEAQVRGLTFGNARQHVDHRVQMNHHVGHTQSSQLFKGVLRDQSRGVFNGKIYIARDAQKVSSSQLNHNLLLSLGAEADTQPELAVLADDVKANHGASIGRLDEDRLFYFESRGIRPEEARRLLAHAFVEDVLMKMPVQPLRQLAESLVQERLGDFMEGMQS